MLVNRRDLRPRCVEMELRVIASLRAKRIFQHARNIAASEELYFLCLQLKETSTCQQLQRRVPDGGMNFISILAKGHIPADMYEATVSCNCRSRPLNVAGDDIFSLWRYDRHSVPTIGKTESSFSPYSLFPLFPFLNLHIFAPQLYQSAHLSFEHQTFLHSLCDTLRHQRRVQTNRIQHP